MPDSWEMSIGVETDDAGNVTFGCKRTKKASDFQWRAICVKRELKAVEAQLGEELAKVLGIGLERLGQS